MTTETPIESPEYEVTEVAGTITFTGGHTVTFRMDYSDAHGEGEQPWLGKSVDVRDAMHEALQEGEYWDDGQFSCPNCGERVNKLEYAGMPYEMCASCEHNARRSGWEPGDHVAALLPQVVTVLRRYETETDGNGYDGTPVDVVDEMAAVLRKVAGQEES